MRIIGTVTVQLPFVLDYCAEGPDISPLSFVIDGATLTLQFPPSMADGTDGQSFFPSGWAWWTGRSLLLEVEQDIVESDLDEVEFFRTKFESVADEGLRRFLNAYRAQTGKVFVHPVRIDHKMLTLTLIEEDDNPQSLPEPVSRFFYNQTPADPPLDASLNRITLPLIQTAMTEDSRPSVEALLALDADWLESLGEHARAARIRTLL